MDYIREFDIRLEKEMYYAGETVYGVVILDTLENFKLRGKFIFTLCVRVHSVLFPLLEHYVFKCHFSFSTISLGLTTKTFKCA